MTSANFPRREHERGEFSASFDVTTWGFKCILYYIAETESCKSGLWPLEEFESVNKHVCTASQIITDNP